MHKGGNKWATDTKIALVFGSFISITFLIIFILTAIIVYKYSQNINDGNCCSSSVLSTN